MSTSDMGRRLLSETIEARLDEVLKALRTHNAQQENLDKLETPVLESLLQYSTPPQHGRQGQLPVLEICSEETGAGKTQLLYYIIAGALLPEAHDSIELDGKNGTVVFMDTDGHFNVVRLAQIMASRLKSKACDSEEVTDIEDLVNSSLQHLHIFQPRSMTSLIDTLAGLKEALYNYPPHFSSDRAVHSIIIDSASAFYWEIRAALETDRINALNIKTPGARATSMPPPKPNQYAMLVNMLRSLQRTLGCTVVVTSTAIRSKNSVTGEPTIKTIPAPWVSFPTVKLMVKREFVRKFALGIAWEDAERDRALRQEAVDRGRFVAASLNGDESFTFAITSESVHMLDAERKVVEEEEQQEDL